MTQFPRAKVVYCLFSPFSPQVHPSVTFGYCVQMAKHVVDVLSSPNSLIILVFLELNPVRRFRYGHTKQGRLIFKLFLSISVMLNDSTAEMFELVHLVTVTVIVSLNK